MNAIQLEEQYGAHNYHPLPVVLCKGEGIYVWDENGKSYIDMMSAYSAVSHGHCHPRLVTAMQQQAQQLTVVSRAYYSDKLGAFLQKACQMTGYDMALPMNTGAEAVETAIKAARRWAYQIKGVAEQKAEILVATGNFHGRTTTIVGFSSDASYRRGFGPFDQGFSCIDYGDSEALAKAITPNTAAFLIEPIQGEGGIIIPPAGYLHACAEICRQHNVLLICDEIQTGLGRTGKLLASQHENVKPDGLILGKALGGGMLPVSLFLADKAVMNVFDYGSHGSTFGGNPLASTVALEALNIIDEEQFSQRSAELGAYFLQQLRQIQHPAIVDMRGKGLFIGIEFDAAHISARAVCLRLLEAGILSKETHETVVRLAPPLIITQQQLDEALRIIRHVFETI